MFVWTMCTLQHKNVPFEIKLQQQYNSLILLFDILFINYLYFHALIVL